MNKYSIFLYDSSFQPPLETIRKKKNCLTKCFSVVGFARWNVRLTVHQYIGFFVAKLFLFKIHALRWRFFVVSTSATSCATCSYHFLILLTFWSLTSSFPGSPRDLIKPCLHLDANSPKFSAAAEFHSNFSEDLQNTICYKIRALYEIRYETR